MLLAVAGAVPVPHCDAACQKALHCSPVGVSKDAGVPSFVHADGDVSVLTVTLDVYHLFSSVDIKKEIVDVTPSGQCCLSVSGLVIIRDKAQGGCVISKFKDVRR